MSGAALVFSASLVLRWLFVAASWLQERERRRMLRNIARIKLRSRTPGGSTNTGRLVPQPSPGRAGVEPDVAGTTAPPAHSSVSGAAVHHPGTAVPGSPLDPVDAGVSRGLAFTGPTLAGADEDTLFEHTAPARPSAPAGAGATPPTSPALAGLHIQGQP